MEFARWAVRQLRRKGDGVRQPPFRHKPQQVCAQIVDRDSRILCQNHDEERPFLPRGCCMATTAASCTAGCRMAASSNACELIHSPPDLITSLARSTMCSVLSGSITAISPVRIQPSLVRRSSSGRLKWAPAIQWSRHCRCPGVLPSHDNSVSSSSTMRISLPSSRLALRSHRRRGRLHAAVDEVTRAAKRIGNHRSTKSRRISAGRVRRARCRSACRSPRPIGDPATYLHGDSRWLSEERTLAAAWLAASDTAPSYTVIEATVPTVATTGAGASDNARDDSATKRPAAIAAR